MEEIKLDVQIRNEAGKQKAKGIRQQMLVPGIVYGGKKDATMIKLERKAFERIRRAYHGEIIFHLQVLEGEKKVADFPAMVKEEQHDPVTDQLMHVDFKRISLTEKIHVKVSLIPKGDPIGVKRDSGSLEHNLWEIEVICLPTQIPGRIEVDVSNLEISDNIHVRDLKLPEGVTTKHDPDAIVFTVVPPMKEEAAQPVEGAPTEPEVLKEKKPAEGEKAPAAAEEAKKKPEEAKKPEEKK